MFREMIRALRTLRKEAAFSTVTVLVLGLGIGATTTLFSVLDSVLWRPLPFEESDRMVSILQGGAGDHHPTSPAIYVAIAEEGVSFTDVTATFLWNPVLRGTGRPAEVRGLATSSGLFDLLRSRARIGRAFTRDLEQLPESEAQVVVLAHSLWQRVFGGDPGILGRTLSLDGELYSVVAVMPPEFAFPTFWADGAELWVPFRLSPDARRSNSRFLRVFARLPEGVSLEAARAEMDLLAGQLETENPRANADLRLRVEPLLEPTVGDARESLWMLFGMVGLVLLVACANVAALFLARALSRRRDLAVRRALGAGRFGSAAQLFAEGFWLSLCGGLAGLALAVWSLEALVAFGPDDLPRLAEIEMEPRALVFALVLSLSSCLVFGLAPIFAQRRWDLSRVLNQERHSVGGQAGDRLRRALVVLEVAFTVVLLAGAGLMVRTFHHLAGFDPGFERGNVLTLQLSLSGTEHEEAAAQHPFYESVLAAAAAVPGVRSAGLINHLPVGDDIWTQDFLISGRPEPNPSDTPQATVRVASPELFATLGIDRVAGRLFGAVDHAEAPRVALVNQTLAQRFFPDEEAIGQRFRRSRDPAEPEWTIVGVVEDYRQFQLTDEIRPEIIFSYSRNPLSFWGKSSLVLRTEADPAAVAGTVRERLWELEPELSISNVRAMDDLLADTVGETRFQALALALFALVSLLLSSVGIYGIMSYLVAWRRPDLGVRMAVGASRKEILGWVLGDGLRLVAGGVVLGLGLAWFATRAMERLVHGVEAGDGAILAASCLLPMTVALAAIAGPALRATRLDPVICLREE